MAMEHKLFDEEMCIINLGLPGFYESVKEQGATCLHVDWQPPAGGDLRLIEILDRLKELG